MQIRVVRIPEVRNVTELCRPTIYSQISQGTLPKLILLGKRGVGWIEQEIEDWLEQRINFSRPVEGVAK